MWEGKWGKWLTLKSCEKRTAKRVPSVRVRRKLGWSHGQWWKSVRAWSFPARGNNNAEQAVRDGTTGDLRRTASFVHHHYWSPSVVTGERREEDLTSGLECFDHRTWVQPLIHPIWLDCLAGKRGTRTLVRGWTAIAMLNPHLIGFGCG